MQFKPTFMGLLYWAEEKKHENKEGAIREISGASREYSVTGDKGAVLERKQ